MSDQPTNQTEFNAKAVKNSVTSGYGADVAQHFACPGCAEPDWKVCKILTIEDDIVQDSVCKHCGRSFKVLLDKNAGQTTFEFVQTGGDDLPDWHNPKYRRV